MTRFLLLLLCLSALQASAQNGNLPQDICANAIELQIGDSELHRSNEWATLSAVTERPAVTPKTCIITIENDLWYRFETIADYDYYEVVITHNFCTTPAGLQALIIRADDCNAAKFEYAACSNLESEDTIKLYLKQPEAGLNYYIWIDGFDGTVCDFNLYLRGMKHSPDPKERFKYTRYDYDLETEPAFHPPNLGAEFMNNATTLHWTSPSSEDASMWIIERMPVDGACNYATVIAVLPPHNTVSGGDADYIYTDYATRYMNTRYCYRIVRVSSDETRYYSPELCVDAEVVESFYVEEVRHGQEPGTYVVKYVNIAKKQDFVCSVLNAEMQEVKSMRLDKEPVRDGTITINMKDFPEGVYYFRMATHKEKFLKQFTVTGR